MFVIVGAWTYGNQPSPLLTKKIFIHLFIGIMAAVAEYFNNKCKN